MALCTAGQELCPASPSSEQWYPPGRNPRHLRAPQPPAQAQCRVCLAVLPGPAGSRQHSVGVSPCKGAPLPHEEVSENAGDSERQTLFPRVQNWALLCLTSFYDTDQELNALSLSSKITLNWEDMLICWRVRRHDTVIWTGWINGPKPLVWGYKYGYV